VRSLILAGACALLVAGLAACGGGGGGGSSSAARTIRGTGFVFQAPASWHVSRSGTAVQVSPKPISPELVSVSVFPLLRAYRPALFAAVTRELDGDARRLAAQLNGSLTSSSTADVAGIPSRQYELGYRSGATDFRERITFVLRRKTEFQLLCRWTGSEPSACKQLQASFRPA
jgi:hypothetical protein